MPTLHFAFSQMESEKRTREEKSKEVLVER
jgi:hypothetical protein